MIEGIHYKRKGSSSREIVVVVEFQIMTDNHQQVSFLANEITGQMRLPGSCLDPTQTHKNSATVLHRVLTKGHKVICYSGGPIAIVRRDPECKMTDVIISGEVRMGLEVLMS